MLIDSRPTFAYINLKNLENNLNIIKRLIAPNTQIIAVVKADAYGHGAVEISKFLFKAGIRFFAVASASEAVEIFNNIHNVKILNFGKIYKEDIELARNNKNYILSINSLDCFNYFSELDEIEIHLKIDTGMGRCGILIEEISFFLEKIKKYKKLKFTGIYSHFPSADVDYVFTKKQIKIFNEIKKIFFENGYHNLKFHLSNSDGIINFPEANLDYVRPGIILYGAYWDKKKKNQLKLKPVMKLMSKVIDIKSFKKGQTIGYKRTFTVPYNNFKIGLIPIGYADGYRRSLSNKGEVLINGKKCKILGLVSMDWIAIDINSINAKIGDDVVLFGDDNYIIDVDEIAKNIGTISYEILTGIGKRVKKVYNYD